MPVPGRKIFLKISAAGLFISLADMLPDVSGSAECIKVFHDEQSIKNDGAGYERQLFGEFQKLRDKKNGRDFVWQNRVGGCFSITPLTTPYVRIRIRRFQFE